MEPQLYSFMRIFLPLITAHVLGDFVLQTKKDIEKKRNKVTLLKHCVIIGILSLLTIGCPKAWKIFLAISLSHFIIDYIKLHFKNTPKYFVFDQISHVFIIVIISIFTGKHFMWENSFWNYLFSEQIYLKILVILTGIVLNTRACGIIIGELTKSFLDQINSSKKTDHNISGLKNGGRIIGYLERLLIMLFIFTNQTIGIGFLIAAKSILRIGEIKDSNNRKEAEYIIIGSFYSYLFGLIVSYVCKYLFLQY
jgi:hypothetical protein